MPYQNLASHRHVNAAAELSILPNWVTDRTPTRTHLPLPVAGGELRAWKYGRFSSLQQRVDSLDRQSEWAEAYCDRQGMVLVGQSSCPGSSGNFWFDREGVEEFVAAARAGLFDVLLIEHLDRIGRDLGIIGTVHRVLTDLGIEIHVTRLGRALDLPTLFALSYEAAATFQMMVDRSGDGHERSARKGLFPNGGCWGFAPVLGKPGQYVKDEEKCEIIRWIYETRLAGLSCHKIALALNARGIPAPKGGQWTASTIWNLLQVERYSGITVYRRTRKPKDPATGKRRSIPRPEQEHIRVELPESLRIVDRETWLAVQPRPAPEADAEMPDVAGPGGADVARQKPRRVTNRRYLLSHLVRCHACGEPMRARSVVGGASTLQCRTYFETRACDNSRTYRMPQIEAATVGIVRRHLADPSLHAKYVETYEAEWERRTTETVQDRQRLEATINELTRKQAALFDLKNNAPGTLNDGQLRDAFLLFDARKAVAKRDLARLPSTLRIGAATPERLQQLQEAFDQLFEVCPVRGDLPVERALMEAFRDLIESVQVTPDPVGRGYQVAVRLRLARTLQGLGNEVETVTVSNLWGLTLPHRQKVVQADYDRAAEAGFYRLTDALWRHVRPSVPYQVTNPEIGRPPKVGPAGPVPPIPEARTVVDAMIFVARTGACIYRLHSQFGERTALTRAIRRCVYHNGWEKIAARLDEKAPEILAGSNWREIKALRKQPVPRRQRKERVAG